MRHIIRSACAVLFMAAVAAPGFAGGSGEAGDGAQTIEQDSETTRVVRDYAGRPVEVPATPSAVIGMTISDTAALVALGVAPIAANDRIVGQFIGTEEYLPEGFDPASLPTFGQSWEPDFERIAALDPDLIIGNEFMDEMLPTLSSIAPTVLVAWPDNGSWQDRFMAAAEALGKLEEARAVEADFQEFIRQLPSGLEGTTVAFARPGADGGFRVDSMPSAFPGSVAAQAGIDLLVPEGVPIDSGFAELSGERLNVLQDADFIVVADFTVTGASEEDGISQFNDNPLWRTLPAVQAGNVAQVSGLVYNGGNYFAARALLDALADLLR